MRNRAALSMYNQFVLWLLGVMFALGVYAIFASSAMTGQALGTMLVMCIGLSFARLLFWLWTRALWQKFLAVSSWLCIVFVVSVSVSEIWNVPIWFALQKNNMEKAVSCAVVFVALVCDCMVLLRLPLQKFLHRSIRALAAGLAILGATTFMVAVLSPSFQRLWDEIWNVIPWQLGAIAALIALSSQVASAIFAAMEKEKSVQLAETFSERMKVSMTCPRCGDLIQSLLGHSACPQCKLSIHIECDEPRCECGYLLHKLNGVHCPECGKEVPERSRWKSAQPSTQSITAAS